MLHSFVELFFLQKLVTIENFSEFFLLYTAYCSKSTCSTCTTLPRFKKCGKVAARGNLELQKEKKIILSFILLLKFLQITSSFREKITNLSHHMFSLKNNFLVLIILLSTATLFVNGIPGDSKSEIGNTKLQVWTAEEDAKVIEMYGQLKGDPSIWAKMSQVLKRKRDSIRKHYYRTLVPNLKDEWTKEEDHQISKEINNASSSKRKHMWVDIANQMKRSADSVRGRSKILQKLLKQGNGAIENSPSPIEVNKPKIGVLTDSDVNSQLSNKASKIQNTQTSSDRAVCRLIELPGGRGIAAIPCTDSNSESENQILGEILTLEEEQLLDQYLVDHGWSE